MAAGLGTSDITRSPAAIEVTRRDEADPLIELLEATADGDREAFAKLYQSTSGRLFGIALNLVRDRQLGEEVLQDAYLTIWRKAGQYNADRGAPLAWLIAVVRNRAIDMLRQARKLASHRPIEDCFEDDALIDDPRALLERNSVVGKLRICLESLPEGQQRALLCAYYYGMTHEELARHLDAPLGTVKSWVRRGLAQLRNQLSEEFLGEMELIDER